MIEFDRLFAAILFEIQNGLKQQDRSKFSFAIVDLNTVSVSGLLDIGVIAKSLGVHVYSQFAIRDHDLQVERRHADKWQQLAGRYDDIRYALRNAPDDPEGHAEFYRECAELIFGDPE